MKVAAILGFYLLSLGSLNLGWLPASASQQQASPAQSPEAAQPLPSPTSQTPNPPAPAKASPPRPRHRKKTVPCSNSPSALNTAVGKPGADPTNSTGSGSTGAASTNPTNIGSAALKPCPSPKKVVRNGGSDEPTVQLTGDTTAEQASHKRASTDQFTAATEENLKKAAERELNPSQREMVSQIKEFIAQSKAAIAAGDLERGHDLALKAHLLSDELVKP